MTGDRRIPVSPCDGLILPREASQQVDPDAIPTLETVQRIAAKMAAEDRLSVWLMAGAGLRVSEAMAVTEDCARGGVLRVYQQSSNNGGTGLVPLKHRAAGDYREIPMAEFVADEITDHIAEHGTHTVNGVPGLLFVSRLGGFATNASYRKRWLDALDALDLMDGTKPRYTPHDLRHLFASTALAGGVSLFEVSRWLGHRSIKVTADTYGHLTEDAPERMQRVMQDALRPRARLSVVS